jgi:hypothetical protein
MGEAKRRKRRRSDPPPKMTSPEEPLAATEAAMADAAVYLITIEPSLSAGHLGSGVTGANFVAEGGVTGLKV